MQNSERDKKDSFLENYYYHDKKNNILYFPNPIKKAYFQNMS